MTAIANAYINALLADAAYVNLINAPLNNPTNFDELSKRMTPTLAAYIAANFEVASSINSSDIPLVGSGFDATVWRGTAGGDFAGQIYVSMRGTEPLPGADLLADGDLALRAAATSPILEMVNWWLRETTPEGEPARQLQWNPLYVLNNPPTVTIPGFIEGTSVAGTGHLLGVSNVQVDGHSMGGHMASAFARIFGAANGQPGSVNIQAISTFNSAGFNGDNAASLFQEIQALLGTGFSSFAEVIALQGNYYAANGVNVTTNDWWFAQMGNRKGLYQEETTGMDNHSMYRLTDLLAVGAALEKLDSTFTMDKLNELSKVGSSDPKASLEGILDTLRLALAGPDVERLPISDAADSDPSRIIFHAKLADLQASTEYQALAGNAQIESLVTKSADGLAGLAKNGDLDALAYRYALKELNPFALLGVDYATLHNSAGELDLYDPETGEGELTDRYLTERARMLTYWVKHNLTDGQRNVDKTLLTDRNYEDTTRNVTLLVDHGTNTSTADMPKQKYIFGGDDNDIQFGGDDNDVLFGGAGMDRLDGGKGDDYIEGNAGSDILTGGEGRDTLLGGAGMDTLEGGKDNDRLNGGLGDDTYQFTSGDGWDWIEDKDGVGHIEYDGLTLGSQTIEQIAPQVWQEQNAGKTFTYILSDWTENGETFQRLSIQGPDGGMWVKAWQAGQLGITLGDPVPPPDLTEISGTGGNDNPSLHSPPHENEFLHDNAAYQKVLGLAGADYLGIMNTGSVGYGGRGNDILVDDARCDVILKGNAGNDELYGGAADDSQIDDQENGNKRKVAA